MLDRLGLLDNGKDKGERVFSMDFLKSVKATRLNYSQHIINYFKCSFDYYDNDDKDEAYIQQVRSSIDYQSLSRKSSVRRGSSYTPQADDSFQRIENFNNQKHHILSNIFYYCCRPSETFKRLMDECNEKERPLTKEKREQIFYEMILLCTFSKICKQYYASIKNDGAADLFQGTTEPLILIKIWLSLD